MFINKKRLLLVSFLAFALALFLIAIVAENNEGRPGNKTEGDGNNFCGTNNEDCHENDHDESLTIEAIPNPDDHHLFQAPIYKDGKKITKTGSGDEGFVSQAKAVAWTGKDDTYIYFLDNTDNEGELDITNATPEDGDKFWVGFGYKDKHDTIHVNYDKEGYTYTKENSRPKPVAKISVDPDFPDDPDKTIVITKGDDNKTLTVYLSKEGKATIYFTGRDSYDDDPEDQDNLTYYWDIDGDGHYETGGTGEDMNETGRDYVWNYTETGTYNLKFKVSDGKAESDSIFFTLEIKETEKKPELHPLDIEVEDEDGNPKTEFEKGDVISISFEIENDDESGYGEDTEGAVSVKILYALKSENYGTWYLLYETDTGSKLNNNDKKLISYDWDTSEFSSDDYKIKVVVDPDNEISEWDETNNEKEFDQLITLEEAATTKNPVVSFSGEIILEFENSETSPPRENMDITIDITIQNTGDGDSDYTRVTLYIDNKEKSSTNYFTIKAGETKKLSELTDPFLWSPSTAGTYNIKLELTYYDSGGTSHTIEISKDVTVQAASAITDTDGDGLPDSWEMKYFGNLDQGPNDDPDGDGKTNLQEYQDGTDPTKKSEGNGDGGGFLPAFELSAFVAVVATVTIIFFIARKKGN